MTLARTTIAALIVTMAASFTASVEAASYRSVDSEAVRLQQQASLLYWEVNQHYRHAAHFEHMRGDVSQMYLLARDIHLLAHRSYGLERMAYKLDMLASLLHHFEELVEHIEHNPFHGVGHVHGQGCQLRRLLESMEQTLHSLRAEVRALRCHQTRFRGGHGWLGGPGGPGWHDGHAGHGGLASPRGHVGLAGHSRHAGHGGQPGFSFGGGGFRIRIGR